MFSIPLFSFFITCVAYTSWYLRTLSVQTKQFVKSTNQIIDNVYSKMGDLDLRITKLEQAKAKHQLSAKIFKPIKK